MFDPDAGHHRPLRLGASAPKPAQAETSADDQVLECLRLYCHALLDLRAAVVQAAPISAQRRPTEQADAQHLALYAEADPLWRLHMGEHDGRIFQHAAGPDPLIFRTTGEVERLNTAEDPSEARMIQALKDAGFEPLDAPL